MLFDSALPFGSLTDRAHFLRVSMLAVVAGSACHTPGTPRIDGVAGAPANPATPWTVPASARTPPPPAAPPAAPAATAALAADSATTAAVRFSLTDVVDLALKNNPTTRESWANAQAAANEYGSARGARYPTLNGSINLAGASTGSVFGGGGSGNGSSVVIDTSGSNTRGVGTVGGLTRAQITPAFSLSYLVFDIGGRAGDDRVGQAERDRAEPRPQRRDQRRRAAGGVDALLVSRDRRASRRRAHGGERGAGRHGECGSAASRRRRHAARRIADADRSWRRRGCSWSRSRGRSCRRAPRSRPRWGSPPTRGSRFRRSRRATRWRKSPLPSTR